MFNGEIITPDDNRNVHKYMDISQVKAEQIDDETAILSGYAKSLYDFPKGVLKAHVETHLLTNNKWVPAPYSLPVPNVCQTIALRDTRWYNITKLWVPKCPPKKGVIIFLIILLFYKKNIF